MAELTKRQKAKLDRDIDRQNEIAMEQLDIMREELPPGVDLIGVLYAMWINATYFLVDAGWTGEELAKDLAWHADQAVALFKKIAAQEATKNSRKSKSYAIPAGDYYLGDPCYAFSDARWAEVLRAGKMFQKNPINVDGHRLIVFKTALGDGVYPCCVTVDGEPRLFSQIGVDAAVIGLVPVAAADVPPKGMFRVTFAEPTIAQARGAHLVFGSYDVDTNPTNLPPLPALPDSVSRGTC